MKKDSESQDKKIDCLINIYSNSQEMVKIADNKANITLTIQTLLFMVLTGIFLFSDSTI